MSPTRCAACNTPFHPGEDARPACQSPDRKIDTVDAPMKLHFGVRTQARYGEKGKVAPHRKQYVEVKWSHDRQRDEERTMVTDEENDYYLQVWRTLDTGEETYRKEGKLSDPAVHGSSARRGKQQGGNGGTA